MAILWPAPGDDSGAMSQSANNCFRGKISRFVLLACSLDIPPCCGWNLSALTQEYTANYFSLFSP